MSAAFRVAFNELNHKGDHRSASSRKTLKEAFDAADDLGVRLRHELNTKPHLKGYIGQNIGTYIFEHTIDTSGFFESANLSTDYVFGSNVMVAGGASNDSTWQISTAAGTNWDAHGSTGLGWTREGNWTMRSAVRNSDIRGISINMVSGNTLSLGNLYEKSRLFGNIPIHVVTNSSRYLIQGTSTVGLGSCSVTSGSGSFCN